MMDTVIAADYDVLNMALVLIFMYSMKELMSLFDE